MKDKVAAIVVWYNPEEEHIFENVNSYASSVGNVYVVDNSDGSPSNQLLAFLSNLPNVIYIPFGENKGIAYALNTGAKRAIEDGYEWFLTMDQDSQASSDMVDRLYRFAMNYPSEKLGIIAAQSDTPTRAGQAIGEYSVMEAVITSGNLVNSQAYNDAGGYVDKLFIDYVDFVFSLTVRLAGYKIVQVNEAVLNHNLGHIIPKSFLGIRMFPTYHSPLRRYYIARNRHYMHSKYRKLFPKYLRREKCDNLKMWIKILLYESNKLQSARMAIRGLQDAHKGVFGKYKP